MGNWNACCGYAFRPWRIGPAKKLRTLAIVAKSPGPKALILGHCWKITSGKHVDRNKPLIYLRVADDWGCRVSSFAVEKLKMQKKKKKGRKKEENFLGESWGVESRYRPDVWICRRRFQKSS
jgi:hypothetical protein